MDLAEFSNAVRPLGSRGWTPASGHRQSARSCRAGPLPAKPSRARRVSPLHRREAGNSKHPGPMEPLGLACRLACKTKNGPLRPVFACLLAGRRNPEERGERSIHAHFGSKRRPACPQLCPQDLSHSSRSQEGERATMDKRWSSTSCYLKTIPSKK